MNAGIDLVGHTAAIVAAVAGNHALDPRQVAGLIKDVGASLLNLKRQETGMSTDDKAPAPVSETKPAAPELVATADKAQTAGQRAHPSARSVHEPAVPISDSVQPDYIVCLEDGRKLKVLTRHLSAHFGMSPEEYRRRWGLPADYPMSAPNFSDRRKAIAKNMAFGTKNWRDQHRSGKKTEAAAEAPRSTGQTRKKRTVVKRGAQKRGATRGGSGRKVA